MSLIAPERLPTNPIEALQVLARTIIECDDLKRETVAAAREAGTTWETIGNALGITRQSAWALHSAEIRSELAVNAANNSELSEDEALDIAVEEVRAIRQARRAR